MASSVRRAVLLALTAGLAAVAAAPPPAHDAAEPAAAGDYTTTMPLFPTFTHGPTRTRYTATTTVTGRVDCDGCRHLAMSYVNLGVGPVVIYTTTVVARTPSATTVFECASTAQATGAPGY